MVLESRKRTIIKTLTDKMMEIAVSSTIFYLLGLPTSLVVGLPIAVEVTQIVVYFFNERLWSRCQWEVSHEGHLCEQCRKPCGCPLGRHDNGNSE